MIYNMLSLVNLIYEYAHSTCTYVVNDSLCHQFCRIDRMSYTSCHSLKVKVDVSKWHVLFTILIKN